MKSRNKRENEEDCAGDGVMLRERKGCIQVNGLVDDSEWFKLTAGAEEGLAVAVIKEESGNQFS